MNCSHVGMKRTSEKVARFVWFCGAARAAFLRATGSQSVQVRLNANSSYIFFSLELPGANNASFLVCWNIPQRDLITPESLTTSQFLVLATRICCCGCDGISCLSPQSQGGACVSYFSLVWNCLVSNLVCLWTWCVVFVWLKYLVQMRKYLFATEIGRLYYSTTIWQDTQYIVVLSADLGRSIASILISLFGL